MEDNCEFTIKYITSAYEKSANSLYGTIEYQYTIAHSGDCEDESVFDWCSKCDNAGPICTCDCVRFE